MTKQTQQACARFDELIEIMQKLRAPEDGCPWDIEQDFSTIAPYTIEEAYEVLDAINRQDMSDLREELGDLLFQVVFHSQMAAEQNAFTITDVVASICDKMVRRHPHVFDQAEKRTAAEQTVAWEEIKAAERSTASSETGQQSALDGVAHALPALLRAEKLQKRAARTGFDWTEPAEIFSKLEEEAEEVREAIQGGDRDRIEDEVGDLLFVVANLARRLEVDPEIALRRANDKFERRFRAMENLSEAHGLVFSELSLDDQEKHWQSVKRSEKR